MTNHSGEELSRREEHSDDAQTPDEQIELEGGSVVRAEAVYIYQGPIPDAGEIQRYEQALPGSADRIFKMTESQVAHRHRIEMGGQIIAGILALLAVIGGFVLVYSGFGIYGVLFTASGVSPMVYAFLRTQRRTDGGEQNRTGPS